MKKRWIFLILFLLIILILSFFTYKHFTKPSFSPPSLIINGSLNINQVSSTVSFDVDSSVTPKKFYIKLEDGVKNSFTYEYQNEEIIDKNQTVQFKYKNLSESISSITIYESNQGIDSPPLLVYQTTKNDFSEVVCFIDGILDKNEECDDANKNNNDFCLNNCKKSFCGDGFLNTIISPENLEECDGKNFGEFADGKNMCEKYSQKFSKGDLSCLNCKLSQMSCIEAYRILEFDGINDNININSFTLDRDSTYTFSFWIKTNISNTNQMSLIECNVEKDNSLFHLTLYNKDIFFETELDSIDLLKKQIKSSYSNSDSWNHIVVIYNQYFLKIFINSDKRDELIRPGRLYQSSKCVIGYNPVLKSRFFKGKIDDFRVYNKSLSNKEIELISNRNQVNETFNQSLLIWYKFDEGLGSSVIDHSGNGFDGSLNGNPNWVVEEIS